MIATLVSLLVSYIYFALGQQGSLSNYYLELHQQFMMYLHFFGGLVGANNLPARKNQFPV
jgi:hypothetical protein